MFFQNETLDELNLILQLSFMATSALFKRRQTTIQEALIIRGFAIRGPGNRGKPQITIEKTYFKPNLVLNGKFW